MDLPETDLEPDEACVPEEIMSDPAAGESPNDREQEVKASGETGQEAVQNQASDQEKKRRFLRGGTKLRSSRHQNQSRRQLSLQLRTLYTRSVTPVSGERLSPAYAHRNPFQDGEATDAILISPRELHFFCCKGWSAAKNSFIYHGYYNFHHLLFGKNADGTFFLAVPGIYSLQEQRMAVPFGFPLFKESQDKAPACRRGYWCRLL